MSSPLRTRARPPGAAHLVATALSLVLFACARSEPAPAPPRATQEPRAVPFVQLTEEGTRNAGVETARVAPGALAPRISLPGTLEVDPRRLARIGSRVPGRVVAIPVNLGDAVQPGQALLEVDTVELHQVSMEYLTAVARARQANDALARARALTAERIGAVADLRRAESDAATASAALHEAEEHLHFLGLTERQIRAMRDRTTHGEAHSVVRAPIAGRVVALTVSLGQVLGGTEDAVTVASIDEVFLSARVYERDVAGIAPGLMAEVRAPSAPGRVFSGTVGYVGAVADPASRTVEARVLLPNADGALRPGMSAVAQVARADAPAGIWLPADAVQTMGAQGRSVFVQTGERRFEPRAVTVGDEVSGFVPVREGLREGDVVVVRGALSLRGEIERAELEEEK